MTESTTKPTLRTFRVTYLFRVRTVVVVEAENMDVADNIASRDIVFPGPLDDILIEEL